MSEPKYRRVLLKLSGEALSGAGEFGVDAEAIRFVVGELAPLVGRRVEVGVVIGGGNFLRGRQLRALPAVERTTADTMGMLATTMNALALRDALNAADVPAVAMGTITRQAVCEPFVRRHALTHLRAGRVVILAGGTGSPFFTTDTCAALRAAELDAEVLLKATKVNGVFTADPATDPDARRLERLDFNEMLAGQYGVMDMTAVSLCMESRIPVVVFQFDQPGNILKVVAGESVGTTIGF